MLEAIIAAVGVAIVYVQNERFHQNEQADSALESVSLALSETVKYIEYANHEGLDRTRELELSKLWNLSAIKMKPISPKFADVLSDKGSFWEKEAKLTRREILNNKIALWQVKEQFEGLLTKRVS